MRLRIVLAAVAVAAPLAIMSATGSATASTGAATTSSVGPVTEYFNGNTYILTPTNWHGAKDCDIEAPTVAFCFANGDAMNAFTDAQASKRAQTAAVNATPDMVRPLVSCSGYTKIWNGANWTGTGLAFSDWGYPQNLNSYTPVPFKLLSWFSNGQRGYNSNNCNGNAFAGSNGTGSSIGLPKNSEALNLKNAFPTYSIELYKP